MPVKGADALVRYLRDAPERVRREATSVIEDGAKEMLDDMRRRTPRDASNPGPHAADGLTYEMQAGGLAARIGLVSKKLESEYFWFRFLDGGTKGGEVTYTRAGSTKRHKMTVPARPALRILETSLDAALPTIEDRVTQAVRRALEKT